VETSEKGSDSKNGCGMLAKSRTQKVSSYFVATPVGTMPIFTMVPDSPQSPVMQEGNAIGGPAQAVNANPW
jgi:hypothetical protein